MSSVLLSIGLAVAVIDLGWAAGWRGIPVDLRAVWVGGWRAIRARGQFALGLRAGDVLAAAWFGSLAIGHVVVAVRPGLLG